MKKVELTEKALQNSFRAEVLWEQGTGVWGLYNPEMQLFITADEKTAFQVDPSWEDGDSVGGVHPEDGPWCINYVPSLGI